LCTKFVLLQNDYYDYGYDDNDSGGGGGDDGNDDN
jgi:hypothetical protein